MTLRNLAVYAFCLVTLIGMALLAYQAGGALDKAFGPKGYLGIAYNESLVITEIVVGSPAEDAGLKAGDRIVSINGIAAIEQSDVKKLLSANKAGSTIKITVLRNGQKMTFKATLIKRL